MGGELQFNLRLNFGKEWRYNMVYMSYRCILSEFDMFAYGMYANSSLITVVVFEGLTGSIYNASWWKHLANILTLLNLVHHTPVCVGHCCRTLFK